MSEEWSQIPKWPYLLKLSGMPCYLHALTLTALLQVKKKRSETDIRESISLGESVFFHQTPSAVKNVWRNEFISRASSGVEGLEYSAATISCPTKKRRFIYGSFTGLDLGLVNFFMLLLTTFLCLNLPEKF